MGKILEIVIFVLRYVLEHSKSIRPKKFFEKISKIFDFFCHFRLFLDQKIDFEFFEAIRKKLQQNKVAQNFIAVILSYHGGLQLKKWMVSKKFRFFGHFGGKNYIFLNFSIFLGNQEKVQKEKVARNFIAVILSYHEGQQLEKWLISIFFVFFEHFSGKKSRFCHFSFFQATRKKVYPNKVAQNFIAVILSYHGGLQLEND